MSRKLLTIIILSMSISLLGIIGVQFLWIRNAIRIEEKKFDSNVFKALNQVVRQLESNETMHMIHKELLQPSPERDSSRFRKELSDFFEQKQRIPQHRVFISKRNTLKGKGEQVITTDTEVIVAPDEKMIKRMPPGHFHLDSNANINVRIATSDTIRLEKKEKDIRKLVDQVIWEYRFNDRSLKERIDPKKIARYLDDAFQDVSITTGYEYEVHGGDKNKLILSSKEASMEQLKQSPYKVRLFPNDLWYQDNFLSVFFPNRSNHVYRALVPLLMLSGLFTLCILGTFILALVLILRQKKINEVKSDFINNITHEFKTPIATIGLAADSIVNPKVIGTPDRIRYFTGLIKDENFRMNKQVENILQLSLLDKRELELNPQPQRVNDLLQKACEHMQLQVKEKNGELKCRMEAVNDMARLDEVHFINVVFNLIDNAMKYSKGKPEIEMGTRNEGQRIVIWVQDQGIGMNRKTLNKIFEKFYRAETGNLHRVKGFGLGLSYVKLVVDRHNGTIDVKSKPGEGTRVEISIPALNETTI